MNTDVTNLFDHPRYWAECYGPAPFLPMSRAEMDKLGWDSCDIIIVCGDAYVDHPSFGSVLLARWLATHPALLILDEPLTGLDAAAARLVKDMLRARVDAGATVILTTHILEVAERMADRIGIIAGGRLLAEGTPEQIQADARVQEAYLGAGFNAGEAA